MAYVLNSKELGKLSTVKTVQIMFFSFFTFFGPLPCSDPHAVHPLRKPEVPENPAGQTLKTVT